VCCKPGIQIQRGEDTLSAGRGALKNLFYDQRSRVVESVDSLQVMELTPF
jgi:hypothetical protein